jgi:hypothetical protein
MNKTLIAVLLVVIAGLLFATGYFTYGNKALEQQVAKTEAELKELKTKLDKISAENKKIQVLQDNIAKLQIDIDNLTKEKERVLKENTALENTTPIYENIIRLLKQKNTELEKLIKELETSSSKPSETPPLKDIPTEVTPPKEPVESPKYASPYNSLSTLPKDKIIVVRNDKCDKNPSFDGNFDKIQDVLNRMHIEHTLIGKSELENNSFNWDDKWVIIFNDNFFKDHCCDPEHAKIEPNFQQIITMMRSYPCLGSPPHQIHNTKLSDNTIQKIKLFIETGGYLFTEDLQIEEIIERAFPRTITHIKFIPKKEVNIAPASGAALHPYLKYVFEAPPPPITSIPSPSEIVTTTPVWKISNDSPDIKILKRDIVTVLIVSPELAKMNKSEGAIAVTWTVSPMSGRILHIIGDLGKQTILSQNLIFNFLTELNELRPREKKGNK